VVPRPVSSPEQVFIEHFLRIERIVALVVRRYHDSPAKSDDYASHARLKLVEDDDAVLRKYKGERALATDLSVVVSRLLMRSAPEDLRGVRL